MPLLCVCLVDVSLTAVQGGKPDHVPNNLREDVPRRSTDAHSTRRQRCMRSSLFDFDVGHRNLQVVQGVRLLAETGPKVRGKPRP